MISDNMDTARQMAAQCWCDAETSHIEMNPALCEAVAKRIAAWMDTAAHMSRDAEFYRGILDDTARAIGHEAYVADDGSVHESPVRLKIPELVTAMKEQQ
jgi:hypothetical protein